jgi:hypothetical protein
MLADMAATLKVLTAAVPAAGAGTAVVILVVGTEAATAEAMEEATPVVGTEAATVGAMAKVEEGGNGTCSLPEWLLYLEGRDDLSRQRSTLLR